MLKQYGYISQMGSKSRLSRRLHRLKEVFVTLFNLLGSMGNTLNTDAVYVIDSLPVPVCDNIRIARSTLYPDKQFRGAIASKKRYFYGLKIQRMVTQDGRSVELFLTHGGFGDVDALKCSTDDVPDGAILYADRAYNDYEREDRLKEVEHIQLVPMRKKNSTRAFPPYVSFVQHYHRNRIETAGSLIEQLLPKSIHAVTSQGFELKVALFVIAYSVSCYINS
jgi:Transposase DDE domain